MKIRNKKTGEIGEIREILIDGMFKVSSLAELNEEWEDYKKPKEFWFVDSVGEVQDTTYVTDYDKTNLRKFGNYFETKEEAENAVEKLKAWKRLKDKGLTFCGWKITDDGCSVDVETTLDAEIVRAQQKYITDDLNLLFGGEK